MLDWPPRPLKNAASSAAAACLPCSFACSAALSPESFLGISQTCKNGKHNFLDTLHCLHTRAICTPARDKLQSRQCRHFGGLPCGVRLLLDEARLRAPRRGRDSSLLAGVSCAARNTITMDLTRSISRRQARCPRRTRPLTHSRTCLRSTKSTRGPRSSCARLDPSSGPFSSPRSA